tara:strand:- start:17635 stop:18123 length:489 start_codon:yes stop_codon:yes gene_type:complete
MSETMEEVYDKLTELKDSNKKLENDNKEHENEIINNKKDIENANQEIEQIMKDLIEQGGFKEEEMIELKMLIKLIDTSDKEFKEHKSNMIKCLNLLISFSNQYLENYKLSIQEANKEESKEDQLNELLLLSKEELVGMCKDNDLPHTGSKKKLAEKIMTLYE